MIRANIGPRYLTRAEKRRYASMSVDKIKAKIADMMALGAPLTIINQVRSIQYQRARYEQALRESKCRCRDCGEPTSGFGVVCERCGEAELDR